MTKSWPISIVFLQNYTIHHLRKIGTLADQIQSERYTAFEEKGDIDKIPDQAISFMLIFLWVRMEKKLVGKGGIWEELPHVRSKQPHNLAVWMALQGGNPEPYFK